MFYVRLSALFALFLILYMILTGGMKDFTENIEETNIKKVNMEQNNIIMNIPEATESLNVPSEGKIKSNSDYTAELYLDRLYKLEGKVYQEQSIRSDMTNKELVDLTESSESINCYMFTAYIGNVLKENEIPFYVAESYSPPHVYLLLEKENSNKSVIDIRNYVIGEDKKLTKNDIDEIIKLIQE